MTAVTAEDIAYQAKACFERWFFKALKYFNSNAVLHLTTRARHATNPNIQTQFSQGAGSLESRATAFSEKFTQELEAVFFGKPEVVRKVSFEELTLVDDDGIDRHIERSKMVSWLLRNHGSLIKEVESRLKTLQVLGEVKLNPDALSPVKVVQAVENALSAYHFSAATREEYLAQFATEFLPLMTEGYDKVNALLQEFGLDLSLELTNLKDGPVARLKKKADDGYYPVQTVAEALAAFNSSLSQIYRGKLIDGGLLRRLAEHLADKSVDGKPREISPVTIRHFEFIDKVISALVKDESIDVRIREWLEDLILPIAATALKDSEVTANPNHPARTLIRELTVFGQSGKDSVDRYIGKLHMVVSEVYAKGAGNKDEFERAMRAVYAVNETSLNAMVSSSLKDNEKRQREVRINEAKKRVVLELQEQQVSHYLPHELRAAVTRMLGPWMVVRYYKYGHNSRHWLESLAYLQLYFKAIQPANNLEALKRMVSLRNHLILFSRKKIAKSSLPEEEKQKIKQQFETYIFNLNEIDCVRLQAGVDAPDMSEEDQDRIESADILDSDFLTGVFDD